MRKMVMAGILAAALLMPAVAEAHKKGVKHNHGKGHSSQKMNRVGSDVNRLESILRSVRSDATFSAEAWRTVANESNVLANRIYANTASTEGRSIAADLRKHVREMRTAAMAGNAAEARAHAAMALPFAYQLDDWSSKG